jgi:transcriptional regulator of acetoin/glycerol metabolism
LLDSGGLLLSMEATDDSPRVRRYNRSFCEHEKAGALALLEANGGKIRETARQLGMCHRTLHRWATEDIGIGPRVRVLEGIVREELADRYQDEAHAALDFAPGKREEATYPQLITGSAICVDKMRLLREQSTSNVQEVLSDEEKRARVIAILAAEGLLTEQTQQALGAHEEQQADNCTESEGQADDSTLEQQQIEQQTAPTLPLAAQSTEQQEHLSPATYYTGRLPARLPDD